MEYQGTVILRRTANKIWYVLENDTLKKRVHAESPYLNENRETVAGHGCANRISFREEVEIRFELTLTAILANSAGSE